MNELFVNTTVSQNNSILSKPIVNDTKFQIISVEIATFFTCPEDSNIEEQAGSVDKKQLAQIYCKIMKTNFIFHHPAAL